MARSLWVLVLVAALAVTSSYGISYNHWSQCDNQWRDVAMGSSSTICRAGCLSTAIGMGLSAHGVKLCPRDSASCDVEGCINVVNPAYIVSFFNKNGFYTGNLLKMRDVETHSGGKVQMTHDHVTPSQQLLRELLEHNHIVIGSVNHSTFYNQETSRPALRPVRSGGTHFVLLVGLADNDYVAFDPASRTGRLIKFDPGFVVDLTAFKVHPSACLRGDVDIRFSQNTQQPAGAVESDEREDDAVHDEHDPNASTSLLQVDARLAPAPGSSEASPGVPAAPGVPGFMMSAPLDMLGPDDPVTGAAAIQGAIPGADQRQFVHCTEGQIARGCCPCGPYGSNGFNVCCDCVTPYIHFCA